jgi:hypothetical protein
MERLMILPDGEHKPIVCDLWIPELGVLVDANGSTTREAVRMGIGQLQDYARFAPATPYDRVRKVLLAQATTTRSCESVGSAGYRPGLAGRGEELPL